MAKTEWVADIVVQAVVDVEVVPQRNMSVEQ